MKEITITQINTVYHVQMPDNRIYCLNKHSLKWNLKHVVKLDSKDVTAVMCNLDKLGFCNVYIAA